VLIKRAYTKIIKIIKGHRQTFLHMIIHRRKVKTRGKCQSKVISITRSLGMCKIKVSFEHEKNITKIVASSSVIRKFKKPRRLLQWKRHIEIELCVMLSILRLFHVDHFVLKRQRALSLAWYKWFSCKGKEWQIYCYSCCCQNLKYENFTSSFGWLCQNIAPKIMLHAQQGYFSSFNQSNHWFVALSLTLLSSNLKPPIIIVKRNDILENCSQKRYLVF